MTTRVFGYLLLAAALTLTALVLFHNSPKSSTPLLFSPVQMMTTLWTAYKKNYVEQNTFRTVDPGRSGDTTSEGQGYTMLRAVWMGDKQTFDGAWSWTKNNLERSSDHLFAWLFGKDTNGKFQVLASQGGTTTASDADTDIALALVFAYARWQDPSYLESARGIISDIWANEVVTIDGVPYLVANNIEKTSESPTVLIDPSYFNPAAYRIFAQIDTQDPWMKLVDGSYDLLNRSTSSPLDKKTSVNLPPDWISVNRSTGALEAPVLAGLDTNFGYDALRVPWRITLDWNWSQDPRAKQYLSKLTFLSDQWSQNQELDGVYAHDGTTVGAYESPAMYGGAIGYFVVINPTQAQAIYTNKLAFLYDPDTNSFKETLSYYDDNMVWFGLSLYNNLLPNLTAGLPPSIYQQP
jgi:endoglucanase